MASISWRAFRESRFVTGILICMWLMVVITYFVPMFLLLPIALLPGGTYAYRHITGWFDKYSRYACLCIPIVWCNARIHLHHAELLTEFKNGGNGVLLSTHCSRIDWLLAVVVGMYGRGNRVGFVAEVTTGFMPIVGWSRVLFGDILLQRTFHRDRPRIIQNIEGFHRDGIQRIIFLAPEGAIADPGCEADEKYVAQCGEFMKSLGKEPLTHLLTPRYKGMSAFVNHSPDNVAACTMTFVKGPGITFDKETGATSGGRRCSLALDDPKRMIPDLHTIFAGNLSAFISMHKLDIPVCDEADPKSALRIRDELVNSQQLKDKEMQYFAANGKFPTVKSGADWEELPAPRVMMNVILFTQLGLTCLVCSAVLGISPAKFAMTSLWLFVRILLVYGASHAVGELLLGGRSSESLVGETAIKAALVYLTGRSANQGGKPEEATASKQAADPKKKD
uniref:Phospholipid/glycerol acyltransferase domain-containing protein n=1 Tax=Rhizochromulina marina TaxID=1034831 RepID=A0A7S2SSK6_9STRA|mmetsp:Transcript_6428/g.18851  ORF Transcript_6428/g.18851 Transcript_6428/m.18851 type:complete len:450 (+) Transcript_6428:29-1378(+)